MKKIKTLFIIGIIVVLLFALFNSYVDKMALPIDTESSEYITVEIPTGSTTGDISNILFSHGLIRNEFVFKILSNKMNYEGKYQAGTYMLGYNMSMKDIMKIIYNGNSQSNSVRFTIPEGYDLRRIADTLEQQGLIDKDAFFNEVTNGDFSYRFLDGLEKSENRLEGFLFPDTYEVYKNATEWDIINKMLARFDQLFVDEYYQKAEDLGFTIKEIITLASIIEREALINDERPIVSSVFHNRLYIDMALQSCATVQYILGEVKPNLTIQDTKIESPYNTYLNKGLPPGPIASPGLASIKAALYPVESDYMYFVAKGDGSHAFAVTYDEFLKYKQQYR